MQTSTVSQSQQQPRYSITSVIEQNIFVLLLGLFYLIIGILNAVQYCILFSSYEFNINERDAKLILSYYIIDFIFYLLLIISALLLFATIISSVKNKWKLHLVLVTSYTAAIFLCMIFSITSITLSIVIMVRHNVPIGFTIIRTLTLALVFCFFCALIHSFYLPIKFRQSAREMNGSVDSGDGSNRGVGKNVEEEEKRQNGNGDYNIVNLA